MVRRAAFFTAALVANVAADCETEYKKFLERFPSKSYAPSRASAFCSSLAAVEQHNSGNSRFTMGINFMSDWTEDEKRGLLGAKEANSTVRDLPLYTPKTTKVAGAVDWRSRMPPVKDQGQCGSCWAFSAMAVVDFWGGSHSEQELLDCSGGSCTGYMATYALQWLQSHGAEGESQYPYQAVQGGCQYQPGGPVVYNVQTMSGAASIQQAVNNQVVSVAIQLSSQGPFMHYSGGVYDADCGSGEGHAIAIVGYSDDYWIIRNSWTASWGEGGHIYFKMGIDLCAVESWAPVTAAVQTSGTNHVVV